jgi:hypothetical protein
MACILACIGGLEAHPSLERVISGVLVAPCIYGVVRILRLGITIDTNGVVVSNLIRTKRVEWNSIAAIDAPRPYGAYKRAGITFQTHDGRAVSSVMFAPGPFDGPNFAAKELSALRLAWEQSGGSRRERSTVR